MKTFLLDYGRVRVSSLLASLFLLGFATVSLSQPVQPVITSIRLEGTNVVIVAQVPAGIRKVTLEARSHIGKGSWEPRLVQRLNDAGGEMIFRLPRSANLEMLRVRANATEALPGFFYQGTNTFAEPPTGGAGRVFLGALEDTSPSDRSSGTTREVVESDIWKVRGDTLYFFNQYRGLQVIDLANPDAPVLRGTLNLPAAGEQMYLLDTNHVVLLTRRCSWTSSDSAVLIVNVSGAVPQVVATLPVPGMLQESRLVGTALYVASETYRPVTIGDPDSGAIWEWGSIVSAFDLGDPTTPVTQTTLWYPGSGNVITATDRFLFVSMRDTNNWWRSVIRCVDISARDGKMQALATIRPAGSVADKFKMNLSGDVLTTISEAWSDQRQWVTTLETFSISNPLLPQKLGNLEIKAGERLFATRFDGLVAYVVTFQRIDPLFVINLADPQNPRIAGQVEVPGWSTYIHPLGDRLLTMGVENVGGWHVAVSLFDVHDPAHPALLSRVPVGENYSWSEANSDEKAFSVLPESGLLLVPYQGYSTNGYSTRVQLIDLLETNLVARGAIDHKMQPRRATVQGERVISLSGWELLTVDALDRDHPVVKSQTELAWQVDRVFLQGNYLLELANGASWNNETGPTLRVALADQPDRVLNTFVLTNVPLLGAVVRNDQLFVAQGKAEGYWLPPGGDTNPPPVSTNVILSVFDLASLPQVGLTGQTFAVTQPLGWSSSWAALWPKPGVLVWSGGSSFWGWGWLDWGWGRPGGLWWPWYGGGGSGRLLAFDVGNAGTPKFLSDVNLTTSNWWSFSSAFSAENSVYLSHQTSEFLEGVLPPGPLPTPPPTGTWVQRSYLDVVDYTDPVNPTTRKPVNIPGTLKGLSYQGALLYTVGSHYEPATGNLNWDEWLDASAYDGVSGHLVDSLVLPKNWPHPVLVDGSTIFLGRPAENTNSTDVLEAWTLPMSGRFAKLGAAQLTSPAQNLTVIGNLLAVQSSYQINLFDPAYPSALKSLGASQENGCLSFDLSQADGKPDRGLWIPLGGFGVEKVDLFSPLPSP